jgi:mRNA-degrading endonuclease toxin of MazEF toxin-antitoxin module
MPPTRGPSPEREERWLLVVSSKRDCRASDCPTVVVVIFSAQVQFAGRHDELVRAGDGVRRDSIAQTDLVMFWPKEELSDDRWMGDVMQDTLTRVRARLANTVGIAEP